MLARKISARSGVSPGRNGRSPAADLAAEVIGRAPSCPPPLVGEGREGIASTTSVPCIAPSPTLPRKPAREARGAYCTAPPRPSSCELPGGAVLAVLEHHAQGGELVADAVGFREVLGFAGHGAGSDQGFNLVLVNVSMLTFQDFLKTGGAKVETEKIAGRSKIA